MRAHVSARVLVRSGMVARMRSRARACGLEQAWETVYMYRYPYEYQSELYQICMYVHIASSILYVHKSLTCVSHMYTSYLHITYTVYGKCAFMGFKWKCICLYVSQSYTRHIYNYWKDTLVITPIIQFIN